MGWEGSPFGGRWVIKHLPHREGCILLYFWNPRALSLGTQESEGVSAQGDVEGQVLEPRIRVFLTGSLFFLGHSCVLVQPPAQRGR